MHTWWEIRTHLHCHRRQSALIWRYKRPWKAAKRHMDWLSGLPREATVVEILGVVGPVKPPSRGAHAAEKKMVVQGEIGLTGVRVGDTWILELSKDLNSGTWHEVVSSASPPPRSRNTLTYIRVNQVVLFGGRGLGYDVLNDVWLLDIQEQLNDILQILYDFQDLAGSCSLPRVVHSATLILGGRILVYGGEDTFRHRKDDFWALDIKTIPSTCLLQPEDATAVSLNGSKAWKRLDVTDQKACPFIVPALIVQDGMYVFGGMVDSLHHVAVTSSLRFEGELFMVELVLGL